MKSSSVTPSIDMYRTHSESNLKVTHAKTPVYVKSGPPPSSTLDDIETQRDKEVLYSELSKIPR